MFYADGGKPTPQLGVCVGAMCTFRFVQPAKVCAATGRLEVLEEEATVQVAAADLLAVAPGGVADTAALREAAKAAAAALAEHAAAG